MNREKELETIFRTETELREKMQKKYARFTPPVAELDLGSFKIQCHTRIAEELLNISGKELKEDFAEMCATFISKCHSYRVACRPINILIIADDEIDRGLSFIKQHEGDRSAWGYIFIPPFFLHAAQFWRYSFLHELGHLWILNTFANPSDNEVFMDLLALCVLRTMIQPHKVLYRDIIKSVTYVGGPKGEQLIGRNIQRHILQNPESYLKKLIERAL